MREERFEVVDATGAVRAVLGVLGDGAVGLAVLGRDGDERLRLAVDEESAALTVTAGGNVVFETGWLEATGDVLRRGGYAFLADAGGTPVLGWRVDQGGGITRLHPR